MTGLQRRGGLGGTRTALTASPRPTHTPMHAANPGLTYHYHSSPKTGGCVYAQAAGKHSPLFGVMADSIPIYGPLGEQGVCVLVGGVCAGTAARTSPGAPLELCAPPSCHPPALSPSRTPTRSGDKGKAPTNLDECGGHTGELREGQWGETNARGLQGRSQPPRVPHHPPPTPSHTPPPPCADATHPYYHYHSRTAEPYTIFCLRGCVYTNQGNVQLTASSNCKPATKQYDYSKWTPQFTGTLALAQPASGR